MYQWLSPAKLNLFLYITGRRPDNYHNLQTLFQFIDMSDRLSFNRREDDKINLVTQFSDIPSDKNLITLAAQRLKSYTGRHELGIDIAIDKIIPMGGGLGGASSNAATTLVALNQLWNLNLSRHTLIEIGRNIGADVPIFIYGHTALAQGIGDQLQSVEFPEYWYLVTYPNIAISTVKVFNDPDLKRGTPVRSVNELLSLDQFSNDCEVVVRKRYPKVNAIITHLSQFAPTRLTGTGACVFTQCQSKAETEKLQDTLIDFDVKSFVTKSLNNSPLYSN